LKVFRFEDVHACLTKAWLERDAFPILAVACEIRANVLREYAKLLVGHDQTLT